MYCMTKFNGWKNYSTWNVSLWILNDDYLYREACKYSRTGYLALVKSLGTSKTLDGVSFTDAELDIEALDDLLSELKQ